MVNQGKTRLVTGFFQSSKIQPSSWQGGKALNNSIQFNFEIQWVEVEFMLNNSCHDTTH